MSGRRLDELMGRVRFFFLQALAQESGAGELFADGPEVGGVGLGGGLGVDTGGADVAATGLEEALGAVVAARLGGGCGGGVEGGECAFGVGVEEEADEVADPAAEGALGGVEVAYLEEVGVGDAGVSGVGEDAGAGGAEAAVELQSQHEVGELGLGVAAVGAVALGGLEVVEVEAAALVGDGGDHDDAWGWSAGSWARLSGGAFEGGEEQGGEGEVAKDVGAELELEAVGGLEAFGRSHDAGVVDEEIEWEVAGELGRGEVADGFE